jgi:hypothetical protein
MVLCNRRTADDAFGMESFLNTAEDQLNQLAVAGSPVAWQNLKTSAESEDGQSGCIPWHYISVRGLLHVTPRDTDVLLPSSDLASTARPAATAEVEL